MKVSYIVLYVEDIEEYKKQYEKFGLTFMKEKHGDGPEHYSVSNLENVLIELYPKKSNREFYIKIED